MGAGKFRWCTAARRLVLPISGRGCVGPRQSTARARLGDNGRGLSTLWLGENIGPLVLGAVGEMVLGGG